MYSKRIAVDLAKNVFQLAECSYSGSVIARKRLNRIAFYKTLTQLTEPRSIDIKPIPVKTELQQHIQHLHCMRELWKQNRLQRINLLRGIFREQRFDCPLG